MTNPNQSQTQCKLWEGHQARVAVVGAGAFGSALAQCIAVGGCLVTLFGRKADLDSLGAPGPAGVHPNLRYECMETSVAQLRDFHLVVLATPCQAMRSVSAWLAERAKEGAGEGRRLFLVSAAKGIERGTLLLPHAILNQCLEPALGSTFDVGTLSGPSFAKELQAGLPTSVVVATASDELAARVEHLLHRSFFRVYRSKDLVGVEVGGALKNVIAMVAGAVDGLGLGNNARAAVVTRGLQEIAQVGVKLGANPLTFLGLSGLGDLILTCTGDLSRNRQFGLRCAKGEDPQAIIAGMGQVIEGVATAESAHALSLSLNLDTPILKVAHDVIYAGLPMKEAVTALLTRSHKGEFDWMEK
jgi:glycerol-3-phosphate dehydrogenase (NAD(P)+)